MFEGHESGALVKALSSVAESMASRHAVDKGYLAYRFQTAVSIRMPGMSITIFKDGDRKHTLTNIISREKNLAPAPQHGPWSIYKPSQDQVESQDHQDPSVLSQVKDKTCGLKSVYLKGGSLHTVIPRLTSPPCSLLSPRRRNKQSRFTIISFTQRFFPHISLDLKALPETLARFPRCELESIR